SGDPRHREQDHDAAAAAPAARPRARHGELKPRQAAHIILDYAAWLNLNRAQSYAAPVNSLGYRTTACSIDHFKRPRRFSLRNPLWISPLRTSFSMASRV